MNKDTWGIKSIDIAFKGLLSHGNRLPSRTGQVKPVITANRTA
jgi:hypothetical protein